MRGCVTVDVMRRPSNASLAVGAAVLIGASLVAVFVSDRRAPPSQGPQRQAYQIVAGTSGGTNFRVGELIASLVSHPPGRARCEEAGRCGPEGLIVSTRTSSGSAESVLAVERGTADSGLAEANLVALAVAGMGPFARTGRAGQLRTMTAVYGEDVHLLAARASGILGVQDLRGKRVGLGPPDSATSLAGHAVLQAFRIAPWRVRRNEDALEAAAERLRQGELDAMFYVGGTPSTLVAQLLNDDIAVLIPIDDAGRTRLLAAEPHLEMRTIPLGAYSGAPPVDTVGVPVLWITNAAQPPERVEQLLAAVYDPGNVPLLGPEPIGYRFLELALGGATTAAPLHPGALEFFRARGVLPPDDSPAENAR